MSLDKEWCKNALNKLARSGRQDFADARQEASGRSAHVYWSPRPFWPGFFNEVQALGMKPIAFEEEPTAYLLMLQDEMPLDFMDRYELLPMNDRARTALARQVVDGHSSFSLADDAEGRLLTVMLAGESTIDHLLVVSEVVDGEAVELRRERVRSLDQGLLQMIDAGGRRPVSPRYVARYLGNAFEADRVARELGVIRHGNRSHPRFASGIEGAEHFMRAMRDERPEEAKAWAEHWQSNLSAISQASGIPPARIEHYAGMLLGMAPARPVGPQASSQPSNLVRWPDLSASGGYLGHMKMADGKQRLILLDMLNAADADKLAEMGFQPIQGSPRYDRGIYYMAGEQQSLRPKLLAAAFGAAACPVVSVESAEIGRVFRERMTEKFGANVSAVTQRSVMLGTNMGGFPVYSGPTGRFIRIADDNAVAEHSAAGRRQQPGSFLRAPNSDELSRCADGFLWSIRKGGKITWPDLKLFAEIIHEGREVGDGDLHALQEAVEAAAYRVFREQASEPSREAFRTAQDFYYGLPTARMRTAQSVYLQQYSTPLPFSVVAQRLLLGNDDPTLNRSLLEPTAGNAGLVNLMPAATRVACLELDRARVDELRRLGGLDVQLGDALKVDFREAFAAPGGFDYVITNPPFGQLPEVTDFGDLKRMSRLDHFIPMRALDARKPDGRAVVIFGADKSQSDGTLGKKAKQWLTWLQDHYVVEGAVEIDGRLYARQGAGYNVRLVVIGNKRPEPIESVVLERLEIISSYDALWDWSSDLIAGYGTDNFVQAPLRLAAEAANAAGEAELIREPISVGPADELDSVFTPDPSDNVIVGGDAPAPLTEPSNVASDEEVIVVSEPVTAPEALVRTPPWRMTRTQWDDALESARSSMVFGGIAGNGDDAERRSEQELSFLRYGVKDWAEDRLAAAKRGELELTTEELAEATQRINASVTHRDVVIKALNEGKPVPSRVLSAYPDIKSPQQRHGNDYQAPYQSASQLGEPSTMIPINMSAATYTALNRLENKFGKVDQYVAAKLGYDIDELGKFFSVEQIDALALGVKSVEEGRGIINGDQTGVGKGRWVAGMLRYARLSGLRPVFLTIKPELFTDIFRDISDIGSMELFKRPFIFNSAVSVKRFGTEGEVLFPATREDDRKKAYALGDVPEGYDIVLSTYSQCARSFEKNPKAKLLAELSSRNAMILLDEAHIAAGESNIGENVGMAVDNAAGVLYASATPLKGVKNYSIYRKIFPASVDLQTLPETLARGGEGLQEAISANLARDGVLIRREHDLSKLTFVTRLPSPEREATNIGLADQLADILAGLSYLSGDVGRETSSMNKAFKTDWEETADADRVGMRMQATSMNFGSRMHSINRQFLLGLKINDAVEQAIEDLNNGRKPVFAVENTGEALTRQVVARRLGLDVLMSELDEIENSTDALTEDVEARRLEIIEKIDTSMRDAVLDSPPQFRELLDIMLDRISVIKVSGRYGDVSYKEPESEGFAKNVERLREMISEFPDLALTPLDVIRRGLVAAGYKMGEVSGRSSSLEFAEGKWIYRQHPKADAVSNVAAFQSGRFDTIAITRSGSTGISLHATNRFADSDIRQRNFIVVQKAANIADFMQWLGRVNRKDQVIAPIITCIESGLPAELKLQMMHEAKLRKMNANCTSNRESANNSGVSLDLLNDIGDAVALQWLLENPDLADRFDIRLPSVDDFTPSDQEAPYVNKLMGRLPLVRVSEQNRIIDTISQRFEEKVEEMTQRGVNPFTVDVYDWKASVVSEEELQSGVLRETGSSFDEPVKLARLRYEVDTHPMRSEMVLSRIAKGLEAFKTFNLDGAGRLTPLAHKLSAARDHYVRQHLPQRLRDDERPIRDLLKEKDVAGALAAAEKADWLISNVEHVYPGASVVYEDLIKGPLRGIVTNVSLPLEHDFLLSGYGISVVFPGEESPRHLTLATLRNQNRNLAIDARAAVPPTGAEGLYGYRREQVAEALRAFDAVPDGKLERFQYVLQGNLFRACELAATQGLGYPVLYTDAEGNRNRAVLIKDRISPESIKSLPLGMDAPDVMAYLKAFFNDSHPKIRQRRETGVILYDRAVKDMDMGDGIMIQSMRSGNWRIVMPGSKAKAGALMTDARIFDIGENTPSDSLRLKLEGTRNYMQAHFTPQQLSTLLTRLQSGQHLGKVYLPEPDEETMRDLRAKLDPVPDQKKTPAPESLDMEM